MENKLQTEVYARDINPRIMDDSFFGKGFHKLVQRAEKKGIDVVVGKFYMHPFIEDDVALVDGKLKKVV